MSGKNPYVPRTQKFVCGVCGRPCGEVYSIGGRRWCGRCYAKRYPARPNSDPAAVSPDSVGVNAFGFRTRDFLP